MRKPTTWVPTRFDTNRAVQLQKVRSLKFQEEEMYFPCGEKNGVDQPCSYCKADLRLCFRIRVIFKKCAHLRQEILEKVSLCVSTNVAFIASEVYMGTQN